MADSAQVDRSREQSNDLHAIRGLRSMRFALAVMSLFALFAVLLSLFLFFRTIPKLKAQKAEIDRQQSELNEDAQTLSGFCYRVAADENQSNPENALAVLRDCHKTFPHDPQLLTFEAQVLVQRAAHEPNRAGDLQQAIQLSSDAQAIQPSLQAMEWAGFAFCLQARQDARGLDASAEAKAVDAFRAEFERYPERKATLREGASFGLYCPAAVQAALYPG